MPPVVAAAAVACLVYVSVLVYRLCRNILNGRKTGLPVVVVPLDQNHILWMLLAVPCRPTLKRILPNFIWERITISIYGWEFHERRKPYQKYAGNGKSFMLAGCGKLELWTGDAEMTYEILRRPQDFVQLDLTTLFMAPFGRNVLTEDGESWARQRKIVASVINERISKAVFDEGIRQTQQMVEEIYEQAAPGQVSVESNQLFDSLKKITIHILSGAGMGASVPWKNGDGEKPKPGFKMSYIDTVKAVIYAVTGPILLPTWLLLRWPSWLPGHDKLTELGCAKVEFPKHTALMLEEERLRSESSKGKSRSNIMSQLLQASQQEQAHKRLSDEEMMGNLFVFTAAGFDTTANTLSFALMFLARYPQWHDWLLEEIDEIMPTNPDETLDYSTSYPRAQRIMAFMLETLRLCPALIHIAKMTNGPQTITTSSGTYCFPPMTTVYGNVVMLHLDPEVWRDVNHASDPDFVRQSKDDRDDEFHFRPSRWINPSSSPQPFFQPRKGSFVPWSAGPRVCPGQKMAQVEFTAVMLALLRRHRIDAVPIGQETLTETEARLDATIQDSISILTLQMNAVYDVGDSGKGVNLRVSLRK
ncbi:cytochrome P450 [Rhizodiscina lignyota]|uniref:Cytochrome P450 n=1 Tax=Rhizodiscina lignyota TaxID=1504668 RepID=A0A9P4IG23_9PEZI|nr:cytochrome P450 [Rhizodiscina lignyota]